MPTDLTPDAAALLALKRPEPIHISDLDAHDPGFYRHAKATAAATGAELIIDEPIASEWRPPTPDSVILEKGATVAEYRAAKERAQKLGVPWCVRG